MLYRNENFDGLYFSNEVCFPFVVISWIWFGNIQVFLFTFEVLHQMGRGVHVMCHVCVFQCERTAI